MVRTARVTMTMRDLDRLKWVQGVVDGQRRLYQAAEPLGLTTRQRRRLVRRYDQEGPLGLISRHRNRSNGQHVPRKRKPGSKTQRELNAADLRNALTTAVAEDD
jgi:hypothetical protein